MGYVGKVTAGGATHLVGSTLYGTCSTAAATAAKAVTCANFDQLTEGVTVHVKFTNSNTVANPTLNVNNTGAKSIYRYGTTAPANNAAGSWNAGAVVAFTYDGSAWMMNDWLNTDTNTDTKVTQTVSTANSAYPVLLSPGTATQTNTTLFSTGVTVNPSTNAVVMGPNCTASGAHSVAMGSDTTASGENSVAMGIGTVAKDLQLAIGRYNNETLGGYNSYTSAGVGSAFVVGNGYLDNINYNPPRISSGNACRITYDGSVIAKKAYSTTGADYAEFREWADGNPDNKDRRGYFVTLVDGKIRIASPGDYIEGIISGHPAVLGNFDECWMGRFLRDEWGEYILEDVEMTNPETGEKFTGKWYKQNPDYDPDMEYIPREQRPEWSPVGMLGHLSVWDDGTCEANGYCKVADGGIATASDKGYRVVKRIADNIVEIVFSIYAQF